MSNPRFGRASDASRFGGTDTPHDDSAAEIAALRQQLNAQAAEIRDISRVVQHIWETLGYGRNEPTYFQQVDRRLQALADEIGRIQARSERPAIIRPTMRPAPPPAAPPVAPAVPKPAPPAAHDFGGALRALMAAGAIADADEFVQRVQNGASQQFSSSQNRTEAAIKAVFNLLPQIAPAIRHADLQAFALRALGNEATLIVPVVGMAFDLTSHTDCSMTMTGSRDRVRECIFPGLRCNERVLVRALVRT
jgi:hypothetical protein